MEVKKILGLIKEDIAHLEEITNEFSVEKLPSSDDVDLAIIRAKALLTELELLHKLTPLEKTRTLHY
jgi:exonuclease V gamma subunit